MKIIKINETFLVAIIGTIIFLLLIFIYSDNISNSYSEPKNNTEQDNTIYISVEDLYSEEELNENPDPNSISQLCDNYEDLEVFEEPIPIVWEARLDGCLVSCMGASFTRMPESDQYQHSRFSGNYKDNWDDNGEYTGEHIIEEEFRKDNITLRIYGDWIGVDYAYVDTVFGGKCVPDIDIDKIEIVE